MPSEESDIEIEVITDADYDGNTRGYPVGLFGSSSEGEEDIEIEDIEPESEGDEMPLEQSRTSESAANSETSSEVLLMRTSVTPPVLLASGISRMPAISSSKLSGSAASIEGVSLEEGEEFPPVSEFSVTDEGFDDCGIPIPVSWADAQIYEPDIVLYFPPEAFTTPEPSSFMEHLNRTDRAQSHYRAILANIMLAFSDYVKDQEAVISTAVKEFNKEKTLLNSKVNNLRVNAQLSVFGLGGLSNRGGGRGRGRGRGTPESTAEDIEDLTRSVEQLTQDFRERELAHDECISRMTDLLGKVEINRAGGADVQEIIPGVVAIPYLFNGRSGKCNGVMLFFWIFDDSINIGKLLLHRISLQNKKDMEEGSSRGTKDKKLRYTDPNGYFNFYHINMLAGTFGDNRSWADLVDRYNGVGDKLCRTSMDLREMFLETVDTQGTLYFRSWLHPMKAFTWETAFALAKQTTHSVMEEQSTMDSLFKLSEREGRLKLVINQYPKQARFIELNQFDVSKTVNTIPLPMDSHGSRYSFLSSCVPVDLGAVTSSVPNGDCFDYSEPLHIFLVGVDALFRDKEEILDAYLKLEKTVALMCNHEVETLPFPEEVISRKEFLKSRGVNMPIITYIKKTISICKEQMEGITEEMCRVLYKDPKKLAILFDRIALWKNDMVERKGFSELQSMRGDMDKCWKFSVKTGQFETHWEVRIFLYYLTYLVARDSLLRVRFELSDILFDKVRKSNEELSRYARAWNEGYAWYKTLPRKSIYPDICFRYDDMSDFGNMMLYTINGFNKLMAIIEGKPVADCALLSLVFSSSGIFRMGSLGPNVIFAGPNSSSKSEVCRVVTLTYPPGFVDNEGYGTAKADLSGEDDIDVTRIREEATLSMMGRDDKGHHNESSADIHKNLLTNSKLTTRQTWVKDDGTREMQMHHSRKQFTEIILSNVQPPPPGSALASRYIILMIMLTERSSKSISSFEYGLADPRKTSDSRTFTFTMMLLNWYTYYLEKWEESGLVDPPTMTAAIIVLRLFCDTLRDKGIVTIKGAHRINQMALCICMCAAFKTALWRTMFSEYGLIHLYFESGGRSGEDGAPLDPTRIKEFNPRFFVEHVNPHLIVTPEQVFWVLTTICQTFTPMVATKVLESLKGNSLTGAIKLSESNPHVYDITQFRTINRFAEVLADRKMSKETVLSAMEDLTQMYVTVRNEENGKEEVEQIPYLSYARDASGRQFIFKVAKAALDSLSSSPLAKLEADIMECICEVTNHLYTMTSERYLTAFFYTYNSGGLMKRFPECYAVLSTKKDACKIRILENAIVMYDSDDVMFHSTLRTDTSIFSLGMKAPIHVIDEDYQESAIRERMVMLGRPMEPILHSVNWVEHCRSLRDHNMMPIGYKEKFREMKPLSDYPYCVISEIVKHKKTQMEVQSAVIQCNELLRDGTLAKVASKGNLSIVDLLRDPSTSGKFSSSSAVGRLAAMLKKYGSSNNKSFYALPTGLSSSGRETTTNGGKRRRPDPVHYTDITDTLYRTSEDNHIDDVSMEMPPTVRRKNGKTRESVPRIDHHNCESGSETDDVSREEILDLDSSSTTNFDATERFREREKRGEGEEITVELDYIEEEEESENTECNDSHSVASKDPLMSTKFHQMMLDCGNDAELMKLLDMKQNPVSTRLLQRPPSSSSSSSVRKKSLSASAPKGKSTPRKGRVQTTTTKKSINSRRTELEGNDSTDFDPITSISRRTNVASIPDQRGRRRRGEEEEEEGEEEPMEIYSRSDSSFGVRGSREGNSRHIRNLIEYGKPQALPEGLT